MSKASKKQCSKCEEVKPVSDFHKSGKGYRSQCKKCRSNAATKPSKPSPPKGIDALRNNLAQLTDPAHNHSLPSASRVRKKAVWNAGLVMKDESIGDITTSPTTQKQDDIVWEDVLKEFNLDPNKYEIIPPVTFNKWQAQTANGVEWMYQYKARVEAKSETWDITPLLQMVNKHKGKTPKPALGEGVFNVVIGDWQAGGKEDYQGTEHLISRILHTIDGVKHRVEELRKLGRPLGVLQILCVGDLVEGIEGFYPNQASTIDMNLRSQIFVTTQLLFKAVEEWRDLFPEVRFVAVAGNHGENRRSNGKQQTSRDDNFDTLVAQNVALLCAQNPERYKHVKFHIPILEWHTTVDTCGWILGIYHGHLTGGSGSAENKILNWYKSQAAGGLPTGDAQILVTGHYHHFRAANWGKCLWLQAPALDNGSQWFQDISGQYSDPGLLTFCTYPEERVADLQIVNVPVELRNNPQPV